MSYTTGTTHYNLPQTVGTDKRDWSDTNQAFQDVDAALYGAVQDVAQAASDVDALEARMYTAEHNISTNNGDIAGLDTRVTTVEGAVSSLSGQVTDARQDLEDMICAFNEASATSTHAYEVGDYFIYNDVLYRAIQQIAIGDTIVPDTNCTTTNVTTEIQSIEDLSSDVTQLQTDVGQLQTDVEDVKATVLNTVDATSLTWRDALTALFNNVTLDSNKRHLIHRTSNIISDFFYGMEMTSTKMVFFKFGVVTTSTQNKYRQTYLMHENNVWTTSVGTQTYNFSSHTDEGFASESAATDIVNGTLKLIEY